MRSLKGKILLVSSIIVATLAIACMVQLKRTELSYKNLAESEEGLTKPLYEPPSPQIYDKIMAAIAQDMNTSVKQFSAYRFNYETWPNTCLGLGKPAEDCTDVLTQGWQIEAIRRGEENPQSVFYRTDSTGDTIRRSTLDNNLPPSVQEKVLQVTVEHFNVPLKKLSVTDAEAVDWDGCLGIYEPWHLCTMQLIFGWQITVSNGTKTWVYHTDNDASVIRLKPSATARLFRSISTGIPLIIDR
ncbi:hypothetical protein [Leptothoe spongobia]|uniref:Lipoprotein n=1 Tax=Leptothoe spongobia TAU-MAC 1115 TaxID=1967444 RepID=A0A947DFN9_9CYAN|nr:hypothetical protein [Leptothoe spongobia]MBT9315051.1 hypothetical protein [Leptothoe spongobia TAU-MAC 1115]